MANCPPTAQVKNTKINNNSSSNNKKHTESERASEGERAGESKCLKNKQKGVRVRKSRRSRKKIYVAEKNIENEYRIVELTFA